MAKAKTVFFCNACGYESPKWMGRCPGCNEWNTFSEERVDKGKKRAGMIGEDSPAKLIDQIEVSEGERLLSGLTELDRVLGGGIIPASLVLAGGDPGIGKSTLLLQMAGRLSMDGHTVLYVSAEESAVQIRLRAKRLDVPGDNLYVLAQTRIESITDQIEKFKPSVVIIDSIQTVYSSELPSAPGSVAQVRECSSQFMRIAKTSGASVFLVGHVTKEGSLAGPRVLEHMVDTVLYFEGDRQNAYRILRAVKNRFGSTNEIGIFEMGSDGMRQVVNPSEIFLSGESTNAAGSIVTCTMEGTRPVLVEVQALVSPTVFGNPRRMTSGIDYNRSVMLLAVLEKKAGVMLNNQDVYVNVVGGLKIVETAVDLGLAVAVASGAKNISIGKNVCVIGEIGLTGEVRSVGNIEKRLTECYKLGFETVVGPILGGKADIPQGLSYSGVKTLKQALSILF